jgi:hypothetical protein
MYAEMIQYDGVGALNLAVLDFAIISSSVSELASEGTQCCTRQERAVATGGMPVRSP